MIYPKYFKNDDGTEVCKVISKNTQVFVRCRHNRVGVYEYTIEKREIDEKDMEYNYRYFSQQSNGSEFMDMLKKFFQQTQKMYEALQNN